MKLLGFLKKGRSKSGIILFVVLWMLVILTSIAISVGRGTSIELAITKNAVGQVKAKYLAWAGILLALNQIQEDTDDEAFKDKDTLYYCGLSLSQGSAEDLFKEVKFDDGYFKVTYPADEAGEDSEMDAYGFVDEDRKINLNALNVNNINVFSELLEINGLESVEALVAAYSVLDWKDQDSVLSQSYSAEDQYYMNLDKHYHCKNMPFDSLEELLLVRGVTEELFEDIKPYLTIFPKQGSFKVNFDTASEMVLRSLARSVNRLATNTEEYDADSLIEKMLNFRRGSDGLDNTSDDQIIEPESLALNIKENIIYQLIAQFRTRKSGYFRVLSSGYAGNRGNIAKIEAVINREELKFVYWKRQ